MPDEYQSYNNTILHEKNIYQKANLNATFKLS